jgi:hypothetical protein
MFKKAITPVCPGLIELQLTCNLLVSSDDKNVVVSIFYALGDRILIGYYIIIFLLIEIR